MLAIAQKPISCAEYLTQEEQSEIRHEYIDGEIISMAGGLPNHNQISSNLCVALGFDLRRQPYRVFVADQRLWIPESKIYTYPDVMVVAGEIELQAGRRDTITNPVLIAEVLSESTEKRDRTTKFNSYRSIPSFAEYLLISQEQILVEHFRKEISSEEGRTESDRWIYQNYDQLESEITLSSIPVSLKLAALYDKVGFEKSQLIED